MIEQRVAEAVGKPVSSLRPIRTRGYAMAYHAIADFEDGTSAFVKAGAEEITSAFLRDELRFYLAVGATFMPELLGFDEGDPPLLVLEDLSEACWPPPWDDAAIAAVRKALAELWATPAPAFVPRVDRDRASLLGGWSQIEADPAPFLSLGLCSAAWLDHTLPTLRDAAERAPIEGDAVIHLDVRSDNLCLTERGVVLVDWNLVHVGNPDVDLAAWAPSLHLEGGPPPEAILGDAPELAAALAGFFAARAGLPPPPTAPEVRRFQLAQARIALPWACRELGLRSGE